MPASCAVTLAGRPYLMAAKMSCSSTPVGVHWVAKVWPAPTGKKALLPELNAMVSLLEPEVLFAARAVACLVTT